MATPQFMVKQHTIYSHSMRLVCIIMLLLVQFDMLGCVVSNYSRPVIDWTECKGQEERKNKKSVANETYYRYGARMAYSIPRSFSVFICNIIVATPTYITPYIPTDTKLSYQQCHAVYCVFLI